MTTRRSNIYRNPHGANVGYYRVVVLWNGRYYANDWAPGYVPTDAEVLHSWNTNRKFWTGYNWATRSLCL